METRARKRARVGDYNYDDGVAERSAKRIKKEKNVKQEIKKEIKQEPKNVKEEQKIKIKSEIKREVKIELKKEKKEQKIKLETKVKIKKEPGITEETTDQADESIENLDEDINESGSSESKEAIDISDESEVYNEDERANDQSKKKSGAKYNFSEFKTIVLSGDGLRWNDAKDQPQMKIDNKIIERILALSDVPQIMIWTRVSKSTSNIVHGSQALWQTLFRERYWRLPHEIRNHNFKYRTEGGDAKEPIPQLKIADKIVDWFKEFQRNYIMSSEMKKLLTDLCNHYSNGEPKKGDNRDARMTEESLRKWEEENDFYVPNDYREYCKGCWVHNLALPIVTHIENVCGPQMSLSRLYRIESNGDDDKYPNENYPDEYDVDGKPDLDSISKLVDIPKSQLKADIAGILFLAAINRYTFEFYVSYVNMIFEDGGELINGETILERLRNMKKRLSK